MNKFHLVLLSAIGGAVAYHFYCKNKHSIRDSIAIPPAGIDVKAMINNKIANSQKLKAEADALFQQANQLRESLKDKYKNYAEAIPSDWDYQAKVIEKKAQELLSKSQMIG